MIEPTEADIGRSVLYTGRKPRATSAWTGRWIN